MKCFATAFVLMVGSMTTTVEPAVTLVHRECLAWTQPVPSNTVPATQMPPACPLQVTTSHKDHLAKLETPGVGHEESNLLQ